MAPPPAPVYPAGTLCRWGICHRLRCVEYHRGVLFLTTNRIKLFDEAFLSRFSFAIKFKNLDAPGRYIVWKKFFELAGSKIDDGQVEDDRGLSVITHAQIEDLSQKNHNGRTIKNIVRTAQALALSEGVPMNIAHVTVVLRAQERFLEEFTS